MNNNRPIALFCCNRITPTLELSHAVRALAASNKVTPMVVLGSDTLRNQLPEDLFGETPVIVFTKLLRRPFALDVPRIWGVIARACRVLGLNIFADYCLIARNLAQGKIVFNRLLRDHPIATVLIADDRSLGSEFGVVRAAKDRGVRTVAVPFALSDPEADTIRRISRSEFQVTQGSLFSIVLKRYYESAYPENVRISKEGQALMFLTLGQVLALDHFGARFQMPWAYGGGSTDLACVYGSAIRDMQIGLGVSSEKLPVTGQCSMDILYKNKEKGREIRQSLLLAGEIKADRPIIVCAVPQFLEHGMLSGEDHVDVSANLIADLASTGANVLLSLHPRANRNNYLATAEKYGAVISQRRLIDIISVADVFVATASSTLRWSVLLGIPTIVLDYFEVGPGGMFDASCFEIITSPSELHKVINKLLYESLYRNDKIAKMRSIAPTLDPFDGRNADRFLRLIESIS